jgi:hypothetical protein
MDPLKMAAQFAAYSWFSEVYPNKPREAMSFARKSWPSFVGLAPEGLGRLLIRLAGLPKRTATRRRTGPALLGAAG